MLFEVGSIFRKAANYQGSMRGVDPSLVRVRAPRPIYALYLKLYHDCHRMLHQQEQVLNDGEHRQVIIDGLRYKLRMPRTELFRLRTMALQAQMDSYDPRDVSIEPDVPIVEVPLHVARSLHATMFLATEYVFDYFSEIRDSDYMKWMKELKDKGFPYQGPSSLQESFDTYLTLHFLANFLEAEALSPRLRPNWMRSSASPSHGCHVPNQGAHVDVKALIPRSMP